MRVENDIAMIEKDIVPLQERKDALEASYDKLQRAFAEKRTIEMVGALDTVTAAALERIHNRVPSLSKNNDVALFEMSRRAEEKEALWVQEARRRVELERQFAEFKAETAARNHSRPNMKGSS